MLGDEVNKSIFIRRWQKDSEVAIIYNLSDKEIKEAFLLPEGLWQKLMDSVDERWQGKGSAIPEKVDSEGKAAITLSPWAFALFSKEI